MLVTLLMQQGMRECRWCQPQFTARPTDEEDLATVPWECVRVRGEEHPASEAECGSCDHWELDRLF
jgi:hypothetical protein